MRIMPCCLTIAGSDSGGNAGVQADLRAFHFYRVHGCTVFTALTAQNPDGVYAIHAVPAEFVASQLDAVLGGYAIAALKTGMLAEPETIESVAERIKPYTQIIKVVDPVMVATSGARLSGDSALEVLKSRLLPLADVVTPNIPEAEELSGISISGRQDVQEAAKRIFGRFGCAVLIKGGHAAGGKCAEDIYFDGNGFRAFSSPWIAGALSTHGTGCSFAAALAAELALGGDMPSAIAGAKRYVHTAIAGAYRVGENFGVLGWGSEQLKRKE